jgi:hypothetical protein
LIDEGLLSGVVKAARHGLQGNRAKECVTNV